MITTTPKREKRNADEGGAHAPAHAQHTNAHAQRTKTPYVKFATHHPNGRTYYTKARRYTQDKFRAIISEKQKKGYVCACTWTTYVCTSEGIVAGYCVALDYDKWFNIPVGLCPTVHPSTPYRVVTKEARE